MGRHLSDMFLVKNGLKKGDALSPLLFSFALKFAIRRIQVNQDGMIKWYTSASFYADDVNILSRSLLYTIALCNFVVPTCSVW